MAKEIEVLDEEETKKSKNKKKVSVKIALVFFLISLITSGFLIYNIFTIFAYIKLLTIVFKVPEEVFIYNYTIKGAIYTLPSLIIFMLIAFGIEFVIRKFNKGSLEKVSEELNRGDFI